jgi:DNA-binding transcriptional MerR regulator
MADFDDGKDDGALRTIGEVSEALGIKPHILRYWEQQFPLLQPLKRSGGRRYYRPEDVALVKEIDRLINQEKYTLKGAEAVLRSSGKGDLDRRQGDRRDGDRRAEISVADHQAGIQVVSDSPDLGEVIAGLKNVRARLARALEG